MNKPDNTGPLFTQGGTAPQHTRGSGDAVHTLVRSSLAMVTRAVAAAEAGREERVPTGAPAVAAGQVGPEEVAQLIDKFEGLATPDAGAGQVAGAAAGGEEDGSDDDGKEYSTSDEEGEELRKNIQARRDERERKEREERKEFERVRGPERQEEADRLSYLLWDKVSLFF